MRPLLLHEQNPTTTSRVVALEVDVVISEIDGKRTEKHLGAPLRAKLPLVFQRASPQAAGVVAAVSVADRPNAGQSKVAEVVAELV